MDDPVFMMRLTTILAKTRVNSLAREEGTDALVG